MDTQNGVTGDPIVTNGVLALAQAGAANLSVTGGKAQSLGKLVEAGFPVPPGLVVAPQTRLEELDATRLCDGLVGPFAVRSSGVTEDSAGASLAGRYLSLLDVSAESIVQAISEVRDGAHSHDGESIPVLVQEMIKPVCAGVAFTADPITGDRATTIVSATRGVADRLLGGQQAGDEWKIVQGKAIQLRRPENVANRRLIVRVAKTAEKIAELFDAPQDVEWAWDGKTLWIVQARPITGLPEEVSWDPPTDGVYQRSLRFGEWIPDPVTPLFESWLLPRMERRLHDWLYEQIGQVAPEPLHVTVNGWYYYSLNWLPIPGVAFRINFFNILRRVRKDWRLAAPMFPQTVRFAYQQYEDDWLSNVLPSYRMSVSKAEQSVESLTPPELVALVDDLATAAGRYFGSIATVAGSAYKFEQQLAQFWNKHLKKRLDVSHMVLLQGFELSEEQLPRLATLDWSTPTVSPGGGPSNLAELKTRRHDIESAAETILAGSPRRLRKFQRLLAEAQHVAPLREKQLNLLALPWPVMRRAVLRLGESLVETGAIEVADDVFHLTYSELISLLEKPLDMNAIVAHRRLERSRAARLTAPLWVGHIPLAVKLMFSYSNKVMGAARSDAAIVHGVPASPGRATGRVRVVKDSTQFDSFEDGEVLVAPLTAPAWTDLFDRAAAVVTDVGSALAHASIIAREYGIPAVVGCGDATARLKDGQMVIVDGSTGNVELSPTTDGPDDGTTV